MSWGKWTTAVGAALWMATAAALSACGTQGASAGTSSPPPSSSKPPAAGPSPYVEEGVVDGAPHNRENNVYRRAGEITPADTAAAKKAVDRIRPVVEKLRRQGRIEPEDVLPALLGLGFDASRMEVQRPWSAWDDSDPDASWGTAFGIRIGTTGCVTGRVVESQTWASVNGPYPETGCLYPATGH
ncbi:hypothetical protein ACFQ61_24480 [Streptomyces sp. NPDC056500]|uniref:hypothetical protein n=1 Tax=Streptomyces sp. NPDC056500 TaxID=3345840 RepID=UPI00368062BC